MSVVGGRQKIWVTDWAANADVVYRVTAGKLGEVAWNWPDKPGVMGCASYSDNLTVTTSKTPGMQTLSMNAAGAFTGKPELTMQENGYGRMGPMEMLNDSASLVGTVNKAGGQPLSSDDRVAIIVREGGGGGGKD
ncbi:hypothetical protein [Lentzea indica]|uniref:hypothetical protein n=1 Tax=Lentzea indica TaxID=2604800 RepID=UPI0028A94FE9|nr:hypothetical protein [Lentzea indica]